MMHTFTRNLLRSVPLLLPWLIATTGFLAAQTPGAIFQQATPITNPLDPNGDGWSSETTLGFITRDDSSESELKMFAVRNLWPEPTDDLNSGSTCGTTEIVGAPGDQNSSVYALFDPVDGIPDNGNDRMIFRIRCAKARSSGNFGYSMLLDTDGAIGFSGPDADTNAIPGNPGFELEIRVQTGGSAGIYVDDVDGRTTGINIGVYPLSERYQQSYALHNDSACSDQPSFHDFYADVADLGINSASNIRLFAATSQSGNPVMSGSGADWAGIDDRDFPSQDSIITTLADDYPPTPLGDLEPGGEGWLDAGISNLNAFRDGENVILTWTSHNTLPEHRFLPERSTDGSAFHAIGEVLTGGNAQVLHLSFTDDNPLPGTAWYRLRTVDGDGRTSRSEVVTVSGAAASPNDLILSPNPATESVRLTFVNPLVRHSTLRIADLSGKFALEAGLAPNLRSYTVDVRALPRGTYLIIVHDGGTVYRKRLVKVE